MAYQALQGVKITPKGSQKYNRFVDKNWGVSQAFGGWIFSADCSIGFSDKPTEINMKIVIESNNNLSSLTPQVFDIHPSDLQCSAWEGGVQNESVFDIDFNGSKFEDFVLFSYDLDVQPTQKTLSVVFKDYSVILDKIYIGLVKRQGVQYLKSAQASGLIPVACPDCQFTNFTGVGPIIRDIDYGSYVGINGNTYDNFIGVPPTDPLSAWNYLYQKSMGSLQPNFDLNGGYLILGMEEMYSDVCSTIPEMKYSFKQLMHSLGVRGLTFTNAFTGFLLTGTPYTQNYVGTLREVLNNWCSDFGLQFYASGRSFIGIDLTKEVDISNILTVADSQSPLGKTFSTGNIALSNYKETYSLDNTFKQSVITADVRPRQINTESRDVKNFVSFQPLHPLDFYSPDWSPIHAAVLQNHLSEVRHLTTGVQFANDFNEVDKRLTNFTNRHFRDIDVCIALTKYDKDLRDIYCADRAIHSNYDAITKFGPESLEALTDYLANFAALGFYPVLEILQPTSKEAILRKFKQTVSQNISLHPDFYNIYVGYYYPDYKSQVTNYENNWASAMYKYGVLNIGINPTAPFVKRDFSDYASLNAGLFGVSGMSLTRLQNSFTPSAAVYPIYQEAPYYDLFPYHVIGLNPYAGFSGNYPIYNPTSSLSQSLNNIGFNSYDFYIASLSNEWGTLDSQYQLELYDNLSPICEQLFPNTPTIEQMGTDLPIRRQQWNIKDFVPTFHSEINEVYEELKGDLDNLPQNITDELGIFAVGTDSRIHQECAKLYIAIVPNVRTHPNIRVNIGLNGYYDSFNEIMSRNLKIQFTQAHIDLMLQKPKNICEYSPITVICNTGIILSGNKFPQDQRFSCTNIDDPISILYAGWPSGMAFSNNARSLSITIERNPVTDLSTAGSDGEYYYNDVNAVGVTGLTYRKASTKIVYPISNQPNDLYEYIGVMNTNISREVRTPPFAEIYGQPVAETGNNAALVKTINNTIDPDVKPILNPNNSRFVAYATIFTSSGTSGVLHTVQDYHNYISGLNSYQSNYPTKNASFNVIGSPNLFGSFSGAITPLSGLTNFNITIGDNGVETSLTFANKPPTLPKMEAILNHIGPRLKPK
jgi:hypothetical protein